MKCSKCQEENDFQAYYCHACGNRLRNKSNGWKIFSIIICLWMILLELIFFLYYIDVEQRIVDGIVAENRAYDAEVKVKEAGTALETAIRAQKDAEKRAEVAEQRAREAESAIEAARQAQHIAEADAERTNEARIKAENEKRKSSSSQSDERLQNQQDKLYNIGDDIGRSFKIAYLDYSGKHGFAIKEAGLYECIASDVSINELQSLYKNRYALKLKGEYMSSTKASGGKYYTFDFSTNEKRTRRLCAGKKFKHLFIVRF